MDALAGVLDGFKAVALVTNIPGPLAAARLRTLGAEVVKIEPPRGDALQLAAPRWYAAIVGGMNVVQLDLRERGPLAALEAHLGDADLLITATRANALERLHLQWDRLHVRHPQIVHVALCGDEPPHDDRAGHDLTYQARAGTIAAPTMPRALIGDMAAAERAVAAAMGALLLRERTGRTTRVDVSIVRAATDFAEPYRQGLTTADGALGGSLPTYALYPTRDGYVAVAAIEPHFVERLLSLLGVSTLSRETIGAALMERDALAWEREAEALDVPLAAVR
ncbi:MAG TPA: CoA transferase [Candidatus Baltobacteraceae bacterium]|nr:CoA transferase [Candidatus Baltobacteraceae bacterium]